MAGDNADSTIEDMRTVVQSCQGQNERRMVQYVEEVKDTQWMRRRGNLQHAQAWSLGRLGRLAGGQRAPKRRRWRKTEKVWGLERAFAAKRLVEAGKDQGRLALSFLSEAKDVVMGTRESAPTDEWVRASGFKLPAGMERRRPTVGGYPTPRRCREQGKTIKDCVSCAQKNQECMIDGKTGLGCTFLRKTWRSSKKLN